MYIRFDGALPFPRKMFVYENNIKKKKYTNIPTKRIDKSVTASGSGSNSPSFCPVSLKFDVACKTYQERLLLILLYIWQIWQHKIYVWCVFMCIIYRYLSSQVFFTELLSMKSLYSWIWWTKYINHDRYKGIKGEGYFFFMNIVYLYLYTYRLNIKFLFYTCWTLNRKYITARYIIIWTTS